MTKRSSLFPLKTLIFHYHATNTIIISFLPLYLQYKELSGTEIGWILAIGPFASIFSQPFWGYLSDRYKTVKRILNLSIICMLIMSVIFFQMNSLVALLISGAFFYFFSSPVGALSDSLAQRRAMEARISFGSIRMWGSIGFAFSSLVVGEFLTRAGIGYLVFPYVCLGSLLLIVSFTIKDVPTNNAPVQLADIGKVIKNKPFALFLLLFMLVTITHRANDSFVGIFITELGGTEDLVGTAWFVALVSEAIVFSTAGFWFRKYHPIVFVIFASILYAIRWFIYGATTNPYAVIALQVLHGLTFATIYLAAFDYVSRIIPKTMQSTGHLIFYSVMFGVSGIIGSMGGGFIIDTFNSNILYTFMGMLSTLGVFSLIGYYGWLKKSGQTKVQEKT